HTATLLSDTLSLLDALPISFPVLLVIDALGVKMRLQSSHANHLRLSRFSALPPPPHFHRSTVVPAVPGSTISRRSRTSRARAMPDRKSTRLNSSHVIKSYAV